LKLDKTIIDNNIEKKKNLAKPGKAEFLEEARKLEFEPQAAPRVFWFVIVFFLLVFFLVLSLERLEDIELEKLRLELAERDESKLILTNTQSDDENKRRKQRVTQRVFAASTIFRMGVVCTRSNK